MGREVEAGLERVRDRIQEQNQLTTSQARPAVNLTDPGVHSARAECRVEEQFVSVVKKDDAAPPPSFRRSGEGERT
jgi:hypothetical protein